MASRLVILASSRRPDVYFNVVALNAQSGVREFVIATVGDPQAGATEGLRNLQESLTRFVAELRSGSYLAGHEGGERTRLLTDPERITAFFTRVSWERLRFSYLAVTEQEVASFLREQQQPGTAFDVTSCKNSVLAGAVAWLVSRGGSPIHTFEILREQSFGEADLLPHLSPEEFTYRDLSSSDLVRQATKRVNAATIHRRSFWWISAAVALAVGALTFFVPTDLATPVLAAAATFATIMSGVAILVRNPDT